MNCVHVKSPGRINLIGEHTDYNGGYVLPAAINKDIHVMACKRADDKILLESIDKGEEYETTLSLRAPSPLLWPNYILGVVDEFIKAGYKIGGFELKVTGNVPLGAGLSSSAALECAVAYALNELFELQITKITMVQLAQKAENNFVGVKCGIMDQFASMMGKQHHAIKLNCETLEYEYFPIKLDGLSILLLDTQVKHSLASSEYNTRREECNKGLSLIQKKYPHTPTLSDASIDMVNECIDDAIIKDRCTYVVEEKERLLSGCIELEKGNIKAFGKKMFATHDGLSKQYNVSCKELDFLVDFVRTYEAVLGARMMGGGFGGCTINIIEQAAIEPMLASLVPLYKKQFHKDLQYYVTSIENGTSVVDDDSVFA